MAAAEIFNWLRVDGRLVHPTGGCQVDSETMINTMTDSYYRTLLLEGRTKKLQQLAELASGDRTASEAKRVAVEAQSILRDLAELDEKLLPVGEASGAYSDSKNVKESILLYLEQLGRPVSEAELTRELLRGRHPGYKDGEYSMSVRVGRSVQSYVSGAAKVNPKLKYKNLLVGLPDWPDKMFS
jgi:hypothetical protein